MLLFTVLKLQNKVRAMRMAASGLAEAEARCSLAISQHPTARAPGADQVPAAAAAASPVTDSHPETAAAPAAVYTAMDLGTGAPLRPDWPGM